MNETHMTTAQVLVTFYRDLVEGDIPEFIIANLMALAGKFCITDGALIVKATADV